MTFTITIAGAGSGYTPGILLTILNFKKEFPVNEIRLYDIDEEKNSDMGIIIDYLLKKRKESIKIIVTTDPKKAFEGSDFIFSQIRVGGMEMREKDEKNPIEIWISWPRNMWVRWIFLWYAFNEGLFGNGRIYSKILAGSMDFELYKSGVNYC